MNEQERRRLAAKLEERRRWAEFARTYIRCLDIVEQVWCGSPGNDEDGKPLPSRLDSAQMTQQLLAVEMRDRTGSATTMVDGMGFDAAPVVQYVDRSIPVPLFTPRDRLEFLARATHALMIGTEKRGLTVTPEFKDAPKEPEAGEAPAIEAASGADETPPVESDGPPVETTVGGPA